MEQPSGWVQVMLGVGVALACIGIGLFYNNGMRSTSAWIWSFFGLLVLAFVLMSHFDVWRRAGQVRPLIVICGVGLVGGLLCGGLAAILIWAAGSTDEARSRVGLVVECDLWVMDSGELVSDEPLNILRIDAASELKNAALMRVFGGNKKGRSWPMLPPPRMGSVSRWRVTNYGQSPVFSVSLDFTFIFREALTKKGSSGVASGRVLFQREKTVTIEKIDSGPGSAFIFYMDNPNPYYINITPPSRATLELLGEPGPRTAAVKATTNPHLMFLTPGVLPANPEPPAPRKK